ncbi:uncharacterized protein LOC128591331 [Nycticebus coucang]|uniref:uncharacterized protein LOC128591331 n=1 Tax=Nycticebus coucang TaxID=9470 RepID=UPI00234E0E2F|nr:uncharacterized protein LOC128591331 [Nycticebus coucang]
MTALSPCTPPASWGGSELVAPPTPPLQQRAGPSPSASDLGAEEDGVPIAKGRAGARGRVVTCSPSPPLLREFQSARPRELLPGRNHPARLRRVGRRPRRVRGGGSGCLVTNGPSGPAGLLARARGGPAQACSSRRLPEPHRLARGSPLSRPLLKARQAPSTEFCLRRLRPKSGPPRRGVRLPGRCSFDTVDSDSALLPESGSKSMTASFWYLNYENLVGFLELILRRQQSHYTALCDYVICVRRRPNSMKTTHDTGK